MKFIFLLILLYLFNTNLLSATKDPSHSSLYSPSNATEKKSQSSHTENSQTETIKPRDTVSHIDPYSGKKVTVTVYSEDDCD